MQEIPREQTEPLPEGWLAGLWPICIAFGGLHEILSLRFDGLRHVGRRHSHRLDRRVLHRESFHLEDAALLPVKVEFRRVAVPVIRREVCGDTLEVVG